MKVWPSAALGEVATIDRDGVDSARIEDGTLYVGLENIRSGGDLVDVVPVARGELASTKFRFTPDHVLFGKLRPYLAKVARPGFNGICSTDILPILPGRDLDRGYLAHFLLRPESVAWAASRSTGANLPRLSPTSLAQMRIPLPPVEEQCRVAGRLDRADALRAKRRAVIALLDTLAKSIFMDMFGDPSANPKGWGNSTIGEIAEQVTDGEHQTPRRASSGIKLLSARNVRDGYLDFDDVDYVGLDEYERIRRRCDPTRGDVLISCSGTIGRVAEVQTDDPLSLVRSVALVRPKQTLIRSTFLSAYLQTPAMQSLMHRRAHASGQPNLFQGPIRALPVYLPPMELQRRYEHLALTVTKLDACARKSVAGLDALIASLQHLSFAGEA